MHQRRSRFICIAKAHDQTESIRIKMLLDRAKIPYRVKGESLHNIYGMLGAAAFGPMEFMIPAELATAAEAALQSLFSIEQEIPKQCPACDASTHRGRMDCPSCGLFLG